MTKQSSFASLTEEKINQVAEWLHHGTYVEVRDLPSNAPSTENPEIHAPTASSPNSAIGSLSAVKDSPPVGNSAIRNPNSAMPEPYLLRNKIFIRSSGITYNRGAFRVRRIRSAKSFFLHQRPEGEWELQSK